MIKFLGPQEQFLGVAIARIEGRERVRVVVVVLGAFWINLCDNPGATLSFGTAIDCRSLGIHTPILLPPLSK
jgi:hypothetical protein